MTDLLYTDVEESLRGSVRSTLQRVLDDGLAARLYDEPDTDVSGIWRALAEQLGLAGLLVPESLGGISEERSAMAGPASLRNTAMRSAMRGSASSAALASSSLPPRTYQPQ